jgi:serine/threonine protein kinase
MQQTNKLSNFRIAEVDEVSIKNEDEERTASLVGTEQYIAPETIKGSDSTYSTDYWSLGIILY